MEKNKRVEVMLRAAGKTITVTKHGAALTFSDEWVVVENTNGTTFFAKKDVVSIEVSKEDTNNDVG